jgi:hypothetical protein
VDEVNEPKDNEVEIKANETNATAIKPHTLCDLVIIFFVKNYRNRTFIMFFSDLNTKRVTYCTLLVALC